MHQSIDKLVAFLSECDPNLSPPEMLYQFYLEFCAVDTETIRSQFAILDRCLENCTPAEQNVISDALCDICTEHERIAFLEGIRIGFQLTAEPKE